jgi:hypothetical protein
MQHIPMAGSTMDQIETLEVAKRKSIVRFTLRMYAMRIMTVSPALFPLPKHQHPYPNSVKN